MNVTMTARYRFQFYVYLFCLLSVYSEAKRLANSGLFWQITDVHYDANYSIPDSVSACRGKTTTDYGKFGDYSCDSSWALVESAIESMNNLQPNVDFILWTGDTVPHIADVFLNLEKSLASVKMVTDKFKAVYKNTRIPVYPMVGNHDIWPSDQIPANSQASNYYTSLLDQVGWRDFLDVDQQKTFELGGYYVANANRDGSLKVLVLNSIVWYNRDNITRDIADPGNQLAWLKVELEKCRATQSKAILASHIGPGYFAKVANVRWYVTDKNKIFHRLLHDYSDVIRAAVFGHEHTDSFRLVYDDNDVPLMPLFMAPAVTPWNSSLAGVGFNNPAVRLYKYDQTKKDIVNYWQYYINLTTSNAGGKAEWQQEYSFVEAYNMVDLSPASFQNLIQEFSYDASPLFEKYYSYNSVGADQKSTCVGPCLLQHLCSMTEVDGDRYVQCLKEGLLVNKHGAKQDHKSSEIIKLPSRKLGIGTHREESSNSVDLVWAASLKSFPQCYMMWTGVTASMLTFFVVYLLVLRSRKTRYTYSPLLKA